jgi:hypothetical protein
MVLHIYSLLPTPCSYLRNQKPFQNLKISDTGLSDIHALFYDYTLFRLSPFILHGPHVMWAPWHHSMVHPQDADGEDSLQIWRVAVDELNEQPRTADKGWVSSSEVGHGANNLSL